MTKSIELGRQRNPRYEYLVESIEAETDDCMNWPYAKRVNGYGGITIKNKALLVHRVVAELKLGKPPTGKTHVLHSCHNTCCFNPKHLRYGSREDNMADKLKDGTHNRGSRNGRSKLTPEQVLEIREDNRPLPEIAKQYGVATQTIDDIRHRRRWAWLT